MKNKILFTLISVLLIFMVNGCSESEKVLKPDNPEHTAWLMKLAIDNNDYDRFIELFSEGRKNSIPKNFFDQLSEITTAGTDYSTYELLTFENGDMFLVRVTPNLDGKVYIEDIILVPDEMRSLFEVKVE